MAEAAVQTSSFYHNNDQSPFVAFRVAKSIGHLLNNLELLRLLQQPPNSSLIAAYFGHRRHAEQIVLVLSTKRHAPS